MLGPVGSKAQVDRRIEAVTAAEVPTGVSDAFEGELVCFPGVDFAASSLTAAGRPGAAFVTVVAGCCDSCGGLIGAGVKRTGAVTGAGVAGLGAEPIGAP